MENRPHIMVVDDDHDMLKIVSRALDFEGFESSTAADGSSALALMDERMPDLVVLDLIMPHLDGYQTLQLMRLRSNIPIIILTGKRDVSSLKKAIILGADDYVRKPFAIQVLLAHIKAKLRRTYQRVHCG